MSVRMAREKPDDVRVIERFNLKLSCSPSIQRRRIRQNLSLHHSHVLSAKDEKEVQFAKLLVDSLLEYRGDSFS